MGTAASDEALGGRKKLYRRNSDGSILGGLFLDELSANDPANASMMMFLLDNVLRSLRAVRYEGCLCECFLCL